MIAHPGADDAAASFAPMRAKLAKIAYRMLGSMADAEDVLQEAFIRWLRADRDAVLSPEAFLRKVVTRLCLDQFDTIRRRRETYVGSWLPDPTIEEPDEPDDVTLPLMLALERLSPLERAAFLLHDVFGVSFDEVATTVERDAAAVRQLASRARANVQNERARYRVEKERGVAIANAFFAASRSGDMKALGAMLAADVSVHADGGGKRPTAAEPIFGFADVMQFQEFLASQFQEKGSELVRVRFINGLPGFISREADGEIQTTALDIDGDKVVGIYVVRNPDKLKHLN